MDNPQALSELLHPTQVPIITITIHTHRHIEFNLIICVIRLRFTDIPGYTGAAEHDAREAVVEGFGCCYDADAFGAPDPDAVVGEEFFSFVNAVAELGGPLVDVVEEADGEVLGDTAWTDIGCVETGA